MCVEDVLSFVLEEEAAAAPAHLSVAQQKAHSIMESFENPFRMVQYFSLVHAFCQVVYLFTDISTLVFSICHQRTFIYPRMPNMTPLQRFMRYTFFFTHLYE